MAAPGDHRRVADGVHFGHRLLHHARTGGRQVEPGCLLLRRNLHDQGHRQLGTGLGAGPDDAGHHAPSVCRGTQGFGRARALMG